jgi:hypothetical protein
MTLVIKDRIEFIQFLPKNGVGAEVGVQKGEYAEWLFTHAQPCEFHLVDTWREVPEGCYVRDPANVPQEQQNANYVEVKRKFAGFPNVNIWRAASHSISEYMLYAHDDEVGPRYCFDWVYIDACHFFDDVYQDLESWYPLLRDGGILCGHDYLDGVGAETFIQVKSAVNQFMDDYGLSLDFLTYEKYPTCGLIKRDTTLESVF